MERYVKHQPLRKDARYRGTYRLLVEVDYSKMEPRDDDYNTERAALDAARKIIDQEPRVTAIIVMQYKPVSRLNVGIKPSPGEEIG